MPTTVNKTLQDKATDKSEKEVLWKQWQKTFKRPTITSNYNKNRMLRIQCIYLTWNHQNCWMFYIHHSEVECLQ